MSHPVFDDHIVRKLAEILSETQLSEIEYEIGELRVRVARQITVVSQNQSSAVLHELAPSQPMSKISSQEISLSEKNVGQQVGVIKSPMVGTAYGRSSPEAAPFITLGSTVTKGQTLMIIEAMKVMNQIKAPRDGKITEIFFHEGEPVEYDHPLLILES